MPLLLPESLVGRAANPILKSEGGFPYKVQPFDHQRSTLRAMARRTHYGWLWQMGCAKTKTEIDNAAYLYLTGDIDALVHVAPLGAHRSFVEEQLLIHMTDAVPYQPLLWNAGDMTMQRNKKQVWRENVVDMLRIERGVTMPIISIGLDAVGTDVAKKFFAEFTKRYRFMLNVDESIDIKNTSTDRWKSANKLGMRALYRRIQNGTPAPEGATDYHGQMMFLHPSIFQYMNKRRFLQHYAEVEEMQRGKPVRANEGGKPDPERGKVYLGFKTDALGNKVWKNTDELLTRVYANCNRFLKNEVLKDLPPKLYAPIRYFRLTTEQRNIYQDIAREYAATAPSGKEVYAELAIVRLRRLYQITRGYIGVEKGSPRELIPGDNPALDLMQTVLTEGGDQQTIIWATEHIDFDLIGQRLRDMGLSYVRYDGTISEADRGRAYTDYINNKVQIFLSNATSGGRALTMVNTQHQYWYGNLFAYVWRVQGEDRSHRPGLTHSVLYTDGIAQDTIDETKVLRALRNKHDVSALLTGDPKTDFI